MPRNKQILLIYLLLPTVALVAFWQLNRCDFINFDDPTYVTENIHIRHGITMAAIRWAFTTVHASNWHPVTWMSHMLDVQLFGLNPRRHHLINLLFHIANTLLLFFVFDRMTKAPWKSAFVAALFALHPLHVESVAWVAERKDVLSTFFWMATMAAYIYYVELRSRFRYSAVLIFFIFGLMAKPMLVTLPLVLLLLDYWPLRRLQGAGTGEPGAGGAKQTTSWAQKPLSANKRTMKSRKKPTDQRITPPSVPASQSSVLCGAYYSEQQHDRIAQRRTGGSQSFALRPLLMEKIPLFALAALSCIVTFIAQQEGGAVESVEALPPGVRIANALVSYSLYIRKMILPTDLAVLYPHPGLWPFWQVLGAALFLCAVSFTVIRSAKRFPYLAMGWLWFAGTLVPVLGIVQVGAQAMADRYTYVPLIGLFIMAAWGIPESLRNWRYRKEALVASSALLLPCLFIVTWTQVGYWNNSITLYDHALKVTDHNYFILQGRGAAHSLHDNLRQAISDYDASIEINPNYAQAYYNRGVAYGQLGNLRQAISDHDRAIDIKPDFAQAYYNRGAAYSQLGNLRQAISDYDRAIEVNPEYEAAYINRGLAYDELGNHGQAIADFDGALRIDPAGAEAYCNRGVAYTKLGNLGQAVLDFDKAIEIHPESAVAYNGRGVAYAKLGNRSQAISDYNKAIEINPDYADAHFNRGVLYQSIDNHRQAIADYNITIRIRPAYVKAYYNRGVAYGELGDRSQAISDYDRAIELDPEYANAFNNRGIAYIELGNRKQAIEDLKMAARLNSEDARHFLRSLGIDW